MKANRIGVAAVVLVGSLAFAGNALADTVVITPAPVQSKTIVVKPKPNAVAAGVVVTKPDCDTTVKKTEGPRKTTTTVKRDCD